MNEREPQSSTFVTRYVKYECFVRAPLGWDIVPDGTFHYGGDNKIHVRLRPLTPEEKALGLDHEAAFCEASGTYSVSEDVSIALEQFATASRAGGRTWEELPTALQNFSTEVPRQLHEYCALTVRALRWRYRALGGYNPIISSRGDYWSADGANWFPVPQRLRAFASDAPVVSLTEDVLRTIVDLVNGGDREPVAHELLREARGYQFANPRTATIIGVAAAEVGVKAYIAQLAPQAAWLVDESPSPPLGKILANYLPSLSPRKSIANNPVVVPRRIRKPIVDAVERRNRLVHTDADLPSIEETITALDAIANLLWLLDYHLGYEWAGYYLSYDIQLELGLITPSQ